MRLLAGHFALLVWVSLAVSLDAILIRKEAFTDTGSGITKEVIKEYVTEKGTVTDIEVTAEVRIMGGLKREILKVTEIRTREGDKLVVYRVDHRSRTYVRMEVPPSIAFPFAFWTSGNLDPTGETGRIGRWTAEKFRVSLPTPGGGGIQVVWLTKENKDLMEAERRRLRMLKGKAGGELVRKVEETLKKYGSPVKTETYLHGMKRVEVVKEVSRKSIDESRLKPPKDYRRLGAGR
ncbi:MAG: hypothetical protein Q9N26_05625 [Aquificota bacterium]|nr:hypothetical protein [Aquificota bacterium]